MAREDPMVTVTLRFTRHMTDEDLAELVCGLPERLPRMVREAERSGGNLDHGPAVDCAGGGSGTEVLDGVKLFVHITLCAE